MALQHLVRLSAWRVIALIATLVTSTVVTAQDSPGSSSATGPIRAAASGPRSSPYAPPEQDVFLTDASPGLDTGCTFNTSALNPLTVDIPVDRFVGDVDGNGYLLNPAALVSAGIIPATVRIIMPAFDVDYFGSAPPERDEVSFNGQVIGLLTGDDNVWKLNDFTVAINKIKFPARPAPGAAPTPVNNRLQVRIDTLSSGRWCTQLDWVAMVLPIRPKLALDLEVISGNPMRSNAGAAITKIQEQRFDANCNVTTPVGPIEQFPFSGPAQGAWFGTGSARVQATLKTCPESGLPMPQVTADWAVEGTSQKGTTNWSGLVGTVEYRMPSAVGAYTASLNIKLDNGQVLTATRRLFVTRKPPLVADPRINWYDKGTTWARGETAEVPIISKVVSGIYGYGNASWRYGYFGPPGAKCDWQQLMANPIACDFADCYVFSDVLDNIAGTLGVSGLSVVTVPSIAYTLKYPNEPFLTTVTRSLDPAFPGSARPVGSAAYDRYIFTSHSLRSRGGVFYDSTFNGRYSSYTDFITANFNGMFGLGAFGYSEASDEGPRLYAGTAAGYDSWHDYLYDLAGRLSLPGGWTTKTQTGGQAGGKGPAQVDTIGFLGAAYRPLDLDANGRYDVLEVDIDLNVLAAGSYAVIGRLLGPNNRLIANRPAYESMLVTRADFASGPGRRAVTLRFSGEQIRESQTDGPYTLALYVNSQDGAAGAGSFTTPAFQSANFGERKARLRSVVPTPMDDDRSGKFETVRLDIGVDVFDAGPYQLVASLIGGGNDLIARSQTVSLAAGGQTVVVDLPARAIARAAIDGPYEVVVRLTDTNGRTFDSSTAALSGFASQFESVVALSSSLVEQSIDSNGNGLYDVLRVGADIGARVSRPALIHATLIGVDGGSVATDVVTTLVPGTRRISLDFLGPQIRRQQMNSAYTLELSFRDSATLEEFDALRVPLRGVYVYTTFDPTDAVRAIALNGFRSDHGIDMNNNGLFERLQVDLGVDLRSAGSYEWSARLVDRTGLELGFSASSGVLPAGSTSLRLEFDGRAIGLNGFDGPYFVRSLLVANGSGASLVSAFAGETSALRTSQFEGYVARLSGDINGDGRVDALDVDAFNRALGSGIGDANYNRFADLDRDGRITLNDLRLLRAYLRR